MSIFEEQKETIAILYGFLNWFDMMKAINNGTFNRSVQSIYEEICINLSNKDREYYTKEIERTGYTDAHLCVIDSENNDGYLFFFRKGSSIHCHKCHRYGLCYNFKIDENNLKNYKPLHIKTNLNLFIKSLQHILDSGLNEIRIEELIKNTEIKADY